MESVPKTNRRNNNQTRIKACGAPFCISSKFFEHESLFRDSQRQVKLSSTKMYSGSCLLTGWLVDTDVSATPRKCDILSPNSTQYALELVAHTVDIIIMTIELFCS